MNIWRWLMDKIKKAVDSIPSTADMVDLADSAHDFERSMDFVFIHEGGYVSDPVDPGGRTKYGISQRAYPHLDIINLSKNDAKHIYFRDYWKASGADSLAWPSNLIIFDTAVNLGVRRAKIFLEQKGEDPVRLIQRRAEYYRRLIAAKPKMGKYKKGWFNRLNDLAKLSQVKHLLPNL